MRLSWDEYFLAEAMLTSCMATCDRLSVGCVMVRDKRIIAKGFNGAPTGAPHCPEVNHRMGLLGKSCNNAEHAERNAIYFAAKHGVSLDGCSAYVTHEPCDNCLRGIASAGIKEVFFVYLKSSLIDGEFCHETFLKRKTLANSWGVNLHDPWRFGENDPLENISEVFKNLSELD